MCHGNICRSPLVAAVLTRSLGEEQVRSRALKVYPPSSLPPPAAAKVRDFARAQGLDLSHHRATTLSTEDLHWATLVVYMDGSNLRRLQCLRSAPTCSQEVRLACLAQYLHPPQERIKDPGFMSRGPALELLLSHIVEAAQHLAQQLS